MPRRCQGLSSSGSHRTGVWCGLIFLQPCNLLLVEENSGCSNLALFYVCKANVFICAVLDSAKVGIVWVALCFTPLSFIIAALKVRQLEQNRAPLHVGSSDFFWFAFCCHFHALG